MTYLRKRGKFVSEEMKNILKIRKVGDYERHVGHAGRHPLISVIDYAEVSPVPHSLNDYGVYGIFLHDEAEIELTYGCGRYDYRSGAVICVAPGQVGGREDDGGRVALTGWALLFHPDLLRGTPVEREMESYSFFDYQVNEALYTTEDERGRIVLLMRQMKEELDGGHDGLQDAILVNYIGVMLKLCQRLYNRQFASCEPEHSDLLVRFDRLLHDYFEEGLQLKYGLPTVQYFAGRLCISPGYFGDLVRDVSGDTASDRIRRHVVRLAKNGLAAGKGVTQVAEDLGFEYPQHFSRMFRRQTGMTPSEYSRKLRGL